MSALPMKGLNNAIDRLSGMAGQIAGTMKDIGDMGNQIDQLTKIVKLVRGGGNPMELLASFAADNPRAGQMLGQLEGKNPNELKAYAENMARSYGTDVNTVLRQIGVSVP